MRTTRRPVARAVLLALLIVVVAKRAEAFELSGGVSVGLIQAGSVPHLAVGPRASLSWRSKSGLFLSVHDLCSILPPSHWQEAGVYNQTSVVIGYAWKEVNLGAGPSIATYSMVTCGLALCGRVDGIALGGHVQANIYIAGPLGLSVNAEVDWMSGSSLVLPGSMTSMVVAGPVIRWSDQ